MSQFACNRGCFVCGTVGERFHHHIGTGCCGSMQCNEGRWDYQYRKWLTVETQYQQQVVEWLEAERALRRPKVVVRHERKKDLDPAQARGKKKVAPARVKATAAADEKGKA